MLPVKARTYYPEWLAFAFGLSIDEGRFTHSKNGGFKKGHYEIYFALDYDLEAFKPHSRLARTLVKSFPLNILFVISTASSPLTLIIAIAPTP